MNGAAQKTGQPEQITFAPNFAAWQKSARRALANNLHPENIEKTRGMHQAVVKLVEDGFVPWTMTECFDWFGEGVDRSTPVDTSGGKRLSVAAKVRNLLRMN